MDYEKKLKDALKDGNTDYEVVRWIESNFPELAESEDERNRKDLLNFLQSPFMKENIADLKVAPWIAWVEKQGEQKPAWSEEDSKMFNTCCDFLTVEECAWLKSLKERLSNR